MNRYLAAIAFSAVVAAHAAAAKPVTLQSVYAVKAQSPAAAVEMAKADALTHTAATCTGNVRAPDVRMLMPLLSAWVEQRKLGRRYLERHLHEKMLEFEDGGERYWLLVAFPASQRVGRLKAGQRVEMWVQRIGHASGQPVVVAFDIGTPGEVAAAGAQVATLVSRPIRETVTPYRSGQLRFEYAGARHDPAMTLPELNPSALTAYPDANLSELNLFFGDISNLNARLRLRGLMRPAEYSDYAEFEGELSLRGTYIRLNPSVLRECKLVVARVDAAGADGTLSCRRAEATSDLVPTRFEFSARQ